MYLVNRASVAASASGKEPPRRLEPHELAELIRSNKVRRDAMRIIQRCWKPLVRQWLSRARASLATPHSFAAANVLIDSALPLTFTLALTLTLTRTLTLTAEPQELALRRRRERQPARGGPAAYYLLLTAYYLLLTTYYLLLTAYYLLLTATCTRRAWPAAPRPCPQARTR